MIYYSIPPHFVDASPISVDWASARRCPDDYSSALYPPPHNNHNPAILSANMCSNCLRIYVFSTDMRS